VEKDNDFPREHRKHMLKPKIEWLRKKLKPFNVKPDELKLLPPICDVLKGPIFLDTVKKFDPHIGELARYVRTVKPKNLETLKELVGVPNRVYERKREVQTSLCHPHPRFPRVQIHDLPSAEFKGLNQLEQQERRAVLDMAHQLLYGYADEKQLAAAPYKWILQFILERAKLLNAFVADCLIVCPNEVVDFRDFAAIYITNVIVYGSGTIRLGNNVKLHSYQIKHV